jgi:mannose-6-phosphate isomerase-like protein (cupin superfamily)
MAQATTEKAEQYKAKTFRLRTPLLDQGRLDTVLANTDMMQVRIKVYAEGGENALHTHLAEDHTFVILQGKARFYDRQGVTGELGRYEGILLPRGAFYKFESCGDEPLVLLRVGSKHPNMHNERVDIEGVPLPGNSIENGHVEAIYREGAYFG